MLIVIWSSINFYKRLIFLKRFTKKLHGVIRRYSQTIFNQDKMIFLMKHLTIQGIVFLNGRKLKNNMEMFCKSILCVNKLKKVIE
jgi:hypothetical protein